MSQINDLIKKSWLEHANDSLGVADKLEKGVSFLNSTSDIPAMTQIIVHVFGEHLGHWDRGIGLLNTLMAKPFVNKGTPEFESILRSKAILGACIGTTSLFLEFSKSDQIRIWATASSSVAGQSKISTAEQFFNRALKLAETGIESEDPANRAMAVTGNNLACTLEEKVTRTPEETSLMILAAQSARKYWEIAGTWLEVERAEYRLSQTYLVAGQSEKALYHGKLCLNLCISKNAEPLELFYAYEALCRIYGKLGEMAEFENCKAQAKVHFDKLSEDLKTYCKPSLDKIS